MYPPAPNNQCSSLCGDRSLHGVDVAITGSATDGLCVFEFNSFYNGKSFCALPPKRDPISIAVGDADLVCDRRDELGS